MAGSMKYFVYTADDATDFVAWRDESNVEALNAGTQDYTTGATAKYKIPSNLKPRYCRFRSTDGTVSRNLICLTPTIFNGVLAGTTVVDGTSGKTLTLVEKVGERLTLPISDDTGLNDGDAT